MSITTTTDDVQIRPVRVGKQTLLSISVRTTCCIWI